MFWSLIVSVSVCPVPAYFKETLLFWTPKMKDLLILSTFIHQEAFSRTFFLHLY